jgi:hypothetical protein
LQDLEKELRLLNKELIDLNNKDEKEMVFQIDKMNKIQQKIDNFLNYDVELNLLSMKVGVKEEVKDQLFSIIQESYYVDVEFVNINGECPTIKHILQKEKYWPCICGELVSFINIKKNFTLFVVFYFKYFYLILNHFII